MTAAFAAYKPAKTTGQDVWRGSFDIDDPRAQVARPLGDGTPEGVKLFKRRWVQTLSEYAEHVKKPGRAHEITANLVKLIERMLWRCVDNVSGRCEATLERIMEVTGFARPTVVRLLALARKWGFVDWVRRTEKTGNAPGEGPQVRQTANAYFFEVGKLPVEAKRRLRQLLGTAAIEYADRRGSGPVPKKLVRQARNLLRGLVRRMSTSSRAGPTEMRALDERLEALPREQWAAAIFPNDPEAQRRFNEETGVSQGGSASSDMSPESPP